MKATAQALYILLIHLLGDTLSPAIVGKLADLYNLQMALLLPAVANVLAGVIFLLGCRRVGDELRRVQEVTCQAGPELPRAGNITLGVEPR